MPNLQGVNGLYPFQEMRRIEQLDLVCQELKWMDMIFLKFMKRWERRLIVLERVADRLFLNRS